MNALYFHNLNISGKIAAILALKPSNLPSSSLIWKYYKEFSCTLSYRFNSSTYSGTFSSRSWSWLDHSSRNNSGTGEGVGPNFDFPKCLTGILKDQNF